MAMPSERDDGLAALLADLEYAAKTPAKLRVSKISHLVDKVGHKAYEEGLTNASLSRLVDIVTLPNELDQASLGGLVRNLYPASKVPDAIVIKIAGGLGHGRSKPSYSVQGALLKWLVMVYDVLENKRILSQLYSILFNHLDTVAIRSQLCHVLSLVTRRKHVRPFRIQMLMELTRQAGNEPPLVGLMRVYKDFFPDIIVGDVTSGRASVFTHPDPEWRQRLGEIQEYHFQKTQDRLPPEKRTFSVTRKGVDGSKRKYSPIIPEVHTSRALESSITLEEIEDVHEFVRKLEKIELPNQLVAVINDPLLQKFLLLMSSDTNSKRIDSWLLAFFEDQLEDSTSSDSEIFEMLEAVLGYTRYNKTLPSACLTYLKSMIHSWNGVKDRDVVLDLLTYTPLGSFEGLHSSIFQPLEEAVLDDGSTESKVALLEFYRNLLDQWTVTLLSQHQPSSDASSAVTSLITHANSLALTMVQTCLNVNTLSKILAFYEANASLISLPSLRSTIRVTIPPTELIYTLQFTDSLSTISRLCAILALYKRAFEIAMSPKPIESLALNQQSYSKEYVNHFNGFLMDVCNCLWRSRAFNSSDPNALACLMAPAVTQILSKYVASIDTSMSLATLFSFSFSPVFCLLAISYVRELEDRAEDEIDLRHPGPPTSKSLLQLEKDGGLRLPWPDYKLGVLHYMENKGVKGVGELMYNTMKHLMTARENKA
ncbi:Mis6-domain-containing protein [Hyaloscypha bicolor E]|uniref:Mis6-domain-containing protein n=1 Tax=Hyaloscypha bicolor E TaxID=1095630 RepID=A0A2J6TQ68_9HELO|nr:Mis6-domain-containing protein [Hyaloscypha bicolor E]PMD65163.1 Mis6-domain-containing protein [Hyaloscypha bicolor E]